MKFPAAPDTLVQNITMIAHYTIAAPYDTDDARWQAVQTRDKRADGHFVYAVRTTGVYCCPSALARLPKRENVEFFACAAEAKAAGYRCSRRAGSDRTAVAAAHAALCQQACRLIESAPSAPRLTELAAQVGMSPAHFHRVFKAVTGLTPKAYASAVRARKLRDELNACGTITDAIYSAGFNANSRFYESSAQTRGMRATQYRAVRVRRSALRWRNAPWERYWWRVASAGFALSRWVTTRIVWRARCKTGFPGPN